MSTSGIAGMFVHTANWGATVAFWQRLGYEIEFDTGHGSGRLRHPAGGPYLFVVEDPTRSREGFLPVLETPDADAFSTQPTTTNGATSAELAFSPTHWGTLMTQLQDPDNRAVAIEAPTNDAQGSAHGDGLS